MYNFDLEKTPPVMNYLFTKNEGLHRYPTRQEQDYHVPIYKTDLGNRFIRKTGIQVWMELKNKFECRTTIIEFKHNVKIQILSEYKDSY